ncbi:helix-turn-helix domain-containing protein [Streptomyces capoamus]|uniref:helix-turn-helix domain-containing protein n=1 Tax=Streptomyces capoamus TaxID=68183 RepID=UPI001674B15F|nr:helix-turn-helix domain-containing protein [Streptomyces capoamus]
MDLIRAYSNRSDLLEVLVSASSNLGQARAAEAVGIPQRVSVQSDARPESAWRVTDRLDDEAIAELVRAFREDGTSKQQLAERHGISESSVKRILRKHRSTTIA